MEGEEGEEEEEEEQEEEEGSRAGSTDLSVQLFSATEPEIGSKLCSSVLSRPPADTAATPHSQFPPPVPIRFGPK